MSSATTSAPPLRVRVTSSSIFSAGSRSAIGLPSTEQADGTGTIVSPCEPSVSVVTDRTGTDSSSATKFVNRAVSSIPACPITRPRGSPDTDDARAYLGTAIPGFPNFFLLLGPNVGSGHGGSMIRSIECQTNYLVSLLDELFARKAASVEVKPEVYEDYAKRIDEAHETMVWTHGGATNWYRNSRGRVTAITPWRNDDFWRMTRQAKADEYRFE